jgi:hypothetical protein
MRNSLLLAAILLLARIASAQELNIKGQIMDNEGNSLPSATVILLLGKDSVMSNFAISDKDGFFAMAKVPAKNDYVLRITFVGFATKVMPLPASSGSNIDLGKILMGEDDKILSEVVIKTDRIPITIKKDTIEYDALAFKVQPNAVVEDLLKRLPGMEVDEQGGITAQGETVQRVLVDGKEFFGRDPKMATQNLPADAVAKVQVFDQKSEQSIFTGIDDGKREKTINLELKEGKKVGAFGNTSLGFGADDRFQGKVNINRFNKKSQFSVLGMGNNINMQGFSVGEYMNFSGSSQQMLGGGGARLNFGNTGGVPVNFGGRSGSNGITTSWAGGVNGNRKLSDKTEFNGSYFYNFLENNVITDLERENFIPTGNFNFVQNSLKNNINNSHKANIRFDTKLDSMNSILVTADASIGDSESNQESNSTTRLANGDLQNASNQATTNLSSNSNINSEVLWRHKFSKKGRSLSVTTNIANTASEGEGTLNATNIFYRNTTITQVLKQRNTQNTTNTTLGTNFRYTEPLGNRNYLEMSYLFSRNRNEVDQQVFDVKENGETANDQLSNKFNSVYLFQRPGISFQSNRDSYNYSFGTSLQITSLNGLLEIQNIPIENSFVNFLPTARFNYDFSPSKRMSIDYNTNVQEPSIQQLQPLVDNRDPLNIYIGNPSLRPSYSQSMVLRYNNFNTVTSIGFFAFVTADYTTNAIVNSQNVNSDLVRTSTPVNVDNSFSVRSNVNLTLPVKKLNGRLNFSTGINRRNSVNVLNDLSEDISNTTVNGNIRFNFRHKEILEANLSTSISRQLTAYQFTDANQSFINSNHSLDFSINFLKGFTFGNDFTYSIFRGQTDDFDQKIPMLDLSLARTLLKKKALEMKFSVTNVLNRNVGVTQNADVNYLERSVTNNLGRYWMVTATYSLNQQLNPMSGGRRGMFNIIR